MGEALLSCAINSTPALFRKEKVLLEVNNRVHDTAIQFSSENRLHKAFYTFRHEWDYKEYHWNRMIRLISIYPEVAGAVNKIHAHNTILMRALSIGAPAKVIKAILELAPETVTINSYGQTPLHTACRDGSSIEIIKALLSVPSGAVAATMTDDQGFTPLHHIIDKSYSINPYTFHVVKALLAANPKAAKMKTKTGWTPLALTTIRPVAPEVKEALQAAINQ